jgi:hypothetical protein
VQSVLVTRCNFTSTDDNISHSLETNFGIPESVCFTKPGLWLQIITKVYSSQSKHHPTFASSISAVYSSPNLPLCYWILCYCDSVSIKFLWLI